MSTHQNLLKSAGTIGGLTGVSRVLGFVRDIVIASAFGTGVAAEAFVVSFKLPNLLRDLVGEGAASAAIVPVLTECRQTDDARYWGLVTALFYSLSAALAAAAFLGVSFAPQIVAMLAPGFVTSADPGKFPLTVQLTRVMFPYVFLIGLSALAMGVLHSLREFTSSALGPILLNLCLIVSGFVFEPVYGPMALAVAVLVGGALQLVSQAFALKRHGFHLANPEFRSAFLSKIGRLLVPRALGSAIYQINVFVDSILASFEGIVGAGGQSALYYSNRLFQLPLAIFGLALAQAALPTFSSQLVRRDIEGFKGTLAMALESLMFVALPASAGLAVLNGSIVRIIFEHGRFDASSTLITSNALFYYAFGLLSCCFVKLLVNAFYAMHDTRTPVKTMFVSLVLNIALSLALMRSLKIGGLALAASASATVNAAILYYFLRRRIGPLDERKLLAGFARILAAAILMAAVAAWLDRSLLAPSAQWPRTLQALSLAGSILACIAAYAALAWVFGVSQIRRLFKQS